MGQESRVALGAGAQRSRLGGGGGGAGKAPPPPPPPPPPPRKAPAQPASRHPAKHSPLVCIHSW